MGNLTFAPAALLHLIGFCLLLKVRRGSAGRVRYWFFLALSFTEFAFSASILMYRFLPFHAHFYIIINSVLVLMYAILMHLVLLDRFLVIYLYLRYETICTVNRTKKLLLSIVLFLVILSIPQLAVLEKSIPSIFKFYMKYLWSTASISFLVSSVAVYGYIYVKLRRSRRSRIHVARQPEISSNAVTDDFMQHQKEQQSAEPNINQTANISKQNDVVFDKVTDDISIKPFDSKDSDGGCDEDRDEENECNNNTSNNNLKNSNNNNNNKTNNTDYSTTNQVSKTINQTAENHLNQISGHQRNEPDPNTSSTTKVTTIMKTKGTPIKLIAKKQLAIAKKKLFLPILLVASFIVFWIIPVIHIFSRLTIFIYVPALYSERTTSTT